MSRNDEIAYFNEKVSLVALSVTEFINSDEELSKDLEAEIRSGIEEKINALLLECEYVFEKAGLHFDDETRKAVMFKVLEHFGFFKDSGFRFEMGELATMLSSKDGRNNLFGIAFQDSRKK